MLKRKIKPTNRRMEMFCKVWNNTISKQNETIYEIKDDFVSKVMNSSYNLPLGTKYKIFCKTDKLEKGMKVCADLFAGKRVGVINEIQDKDICIINGKQTYISDIHYIIID